MKLNIKIKSIKSELKDFYDFYFYNGTKSLFIGYNKSDYNKTIKSFTGNLDDMIEFLVIARSIAIGISPKDYIYKSFIESPEYFKSNFNLSRYGNGFSWPYMRVNLIKNYVELTFKSTLGFGNYDWNINYKDDYTIQVIPSNFVQSIDNYLNSIPDIGDISKLHEKYMIL
jgi:hypothetical protein